jgi:hypothetical protein
MGYACPVCSDPQADAGHLANHLAFTAILGNDDHETWLDEHAPEWNELGEAELADELADELEETEFPQLFEDTAGGLDSEAGQPPSERSGALFDSVGEHAPHAHSHAQAHDGTIDTSQPLGADTAEVLEEARELTKRMRGDGDTEDLSADVAENEGADDDAE